MGKAFVNSVPASLSYHNLRGFSAATANVTAHAKEPNTTPSDFITTPKILTNHYKISPKKSLEIA